MDSPSWFPLERDEGKPRAVNDTFGLPTALTGVGLLVLLGLIIFGGVKRIAEVSEWVVPIMEINGEQRAT